MDTAAFDLSSAARLDLLQIWNWLCENSSIDVADKVIADLEAGMHHVAQRPALGHRRRDLTRRPVLFYLVHSWFIVYRTDVTPLHVVRVLHASRNIKKLLR